MTGLVERVFPIRIQVDSEQEHSRLHQAARGQPPFSYKRVTTNCCDDEPPTAPVIMLQGFGALLGLQSNSAGQFEVVVASDNTYRILGYEPENILALKPFCDLIAESDRAELLRRLRSHLDHPELNMDASHSDVFRCSIISTSGDLIPFWCTSHRSKDHEYLVICEFEPFPSNSNPDDSSVTIDQKPTKFVNYTPSAEEWKKSTTRSSKPIRSAYSLTDKATSNNSTDLITAIAEVQNQLTSTTSTEALFDIIVGTVSELTAFDRVMLYRFDECKCGAVVAEHLNPQISEDLFIGLHFPSSDLPPWIRELYREDTVQILRNRTSEKTSLIYRDKDRNPSVDLTRAYLRDVAPDKVQLFADLDVSSAMSISLIVEGDLWGLIMCHSYGAKILEISPPMREACRNIGDCVSSQIERLLYAERLQARMLLASGLSQKSPAAFITGSSSSLLQLFTAEFGMLVVNDEARAVGKLGSYQEALALVHYFRVRGVTSIIASQKITVDFPDLHYKPGFTLIAGLLAIPLSSSGSDFLIVFRKEQLMEIHWAGNTQERFELIGGKTAEPSAAFHRWIEHVEDTSREWTAWQIEIASVLSTLYGTFTDFWLKRQMKSQKSRKKQLLISNSSHEVRTPLHQIVNYLEIVLDDKLDQKTYEHIEASLTASKSLLFAINDLLDLTKMEDSHILVQEEPFSLHAVLFEVVGAYAVEALRKGLTISFNIDDNYSTKQVIGDPQRLRQAVSNILSNSLEHSNRGDITVEIYPIKSKSSNALEDILNISIKDEGKGMSEQQLDDLFLQLENILDEEEEEEEEEEVDNEENDKAVPGRTTSIGLGLAVVGRFVRNSGGQMKIETMEGSGTRVSIQLPLRTTSKNPSKSLLPTPPSDGASQTSVATSPGVALSFGAVSSGIATGTAFSPTFSNLSSEGDAFPFPPVSTNGTCLHILVAEDNPLNAKVLKMQLSKMGHEVTVAGNGQACLDIFRSNTAYFDVILMDFQMPLIDGPTSTKSIRTHEKACSSSSSLHLSGLATAHGGIPIFAVSASLEEQKRDDYIADGFNGWILKPVNFRRLNQLMVGIWNEDVRRECSYREEMWESGGWLI